MAHQDEKRIQLIRDIRIRVEPLPVKWGVRVGPPDRRSLCLRGKRAETKVEISDDSIMITPPVRAFTSMETESDGGEEQKPDAIKHSKAGMVADDGMKEAGAEAVPEGVKGAAAHAQAAMLTQVTQTATTLPASPPPPPASPLCLGARAAA